MVSLSTRNPEFKLKISALLNRIVGFGSKRDVVLGRGVSRSGRVGSGFVVTRPDPKHKGSHTVTRPELTRNTLDGLMCFGSVRFRSGRVDGFLAFFFFFFFF